MNSAKRSILLSFVFTLLCSLLNAQQTSTQTPVVPRLMNFSAKALDGTGKAITGIAGATFAIYKDEHEGSPLWLETQNVQADSKGNYTAQLGATKPAGLPLDLFTSGEARWLGVRINGGEEQPRVLLLSVPYALKAADAETLGGKPASAFVAVANGPSGAGPATEQANEIVCSSSTACKSGFVPLFSTNGGSAKVTDSIVKQSGSTIAISGSETAAGNIAAASFTAAPSSGLGIFSQSPNNHGIEGVSNSSSAFGVVGENTSSGGAGIYGSGPVGVYGTTGMASSYGVVGVNTATGGIGIHGSAPNGDGFFTENNVQQARTAGGWVKAMALITANGIATCFNSTLIGAPATVPPCGFSLHAWGPGDYTVDFGFQVDDRFFSTTKASSASDLTISVCTDFVGVTCNNTNTANQAEITSFDSHGFADSKIYVIVY